MFDELTKKRWAKKMPPGYTLTVRNYRERFERVVVLDADGVEAGSAHTSVYGLHGAAREAIRDAVKTYRAQTRPESHWERSGRIFGWKAE